MPSSLPCFSTSVQLDPVLGKGAAAAALHRWGWGYQSSSLKMSLAYPVLVLFGFLFSPCNRRQVLGVRRAFVWQVSSVLHLFPGVSCFPRRNPEEVEEEWEGVPQNLLICVGWQLFGCLVELGMELRG